MLPGSEPCRLLTDSVILCKFPKLPIVVGISPVKLLFPMCNQYKPLSLPIPLGIVPLSLQYPAMKYWRDAERLPMDAGSAPVIGLLAISK